MAMGVMIYHLLHYEGIITIPQLGTYAVYCFFVISGFSLYTVYVDDFVSEGSLRAYVLRRFFRIAPLYYLTLAAYLLARGLPEGGWYAIFMNVSFLMGLDNPVATAITTGGWSIGIEMVFYLFLPLIVMLFRRNLLAIALFTAAALVSQITFVNHLFEGKAIGAVWVDYIQPIAFIGYFVSGCAIAVALQYAPRLKGHWAAIAVSLLIPCMFIFVPRDHAAILSGGLGITLTLLTIVFVIGTVFLPEPAGLARVVAAWIGRISYPVYLLHPLIYGIYGQKLAGPWAVVGSIVLSLIISDLVSRFFEAPASALGKRLARRALNNN